MLTVLLNNACIKATAVTASNKYNVTSQTLTYSLLIRDHVVKFHDFFST